LPEELNVGFIRFHVKVEVTCHESSPIYLTAPYLPFVAVIVEFCVNLNSSVHTKERLAWVGYIYAGLRLKISFTPCCIGSRLTCLRAI
jgi:hypothetical protein